MVETLRSRIVSFLTFLSVRALWELGNSVTSWFGSCGQLKVIGSNNCAFEVSCGVVAIRTLFYYELFISSLVTNVGYWLWRLES